MNTTSDVLEVDIDFYCEQFDSVVSVYNSSCDPSVHWVETIV